MMTEEEAKNQSNPKQERTPGPWQCHEIAPEDPDWGAFEIWSAGNIEADNGRIISNGAGIAAMRVYGTANATHIVHCVNTYDEVVGALEDLISHIEALRGADAHRVGCQCGGTNDGKYSCASFLISNERARAALAKAKGE